MHVADHWENSDEGKAYKADAEAADEAGAMVADNMADELAQGYRGTAVDPTPNEAYTVAGQLAAAGTPETDPDAAATAAAGRAAAEKAATGVAEK